MFSQLKKTVSEKARVAKKALFLAVISYLYDIVANRNKKKDSQMYVENVEYEAKDKNNKV